MTKKTLSEEEYWVGTTKDGVLVYPKDDVKKAIKRLKEIDNRLYPNTNKHELFFHCEQCKLNFYKEIDKIFGEKLIKNDK